MMRNNGHHIRILHVVGGMSRGGAETWLMHVLRNIDRRKFKMDFLVHTTRACAYDEEIRASGSRIIACTQPSRPLRYARNFRRILHEHGPYDVIHSHVHHFSGYVLWLASQAQVPIRIAHSHSDTSRLQAGSKPLRQLYLKLMKRLIVNHATVGLAASQTAAAALFGPNWKPDIRWRILYCGIDLAPFRAAIDPAVVRAGLGIPAQAFVVGHVGRFAGPKNHAFLVQIAGEIARREPGAYFLLIGDGPLRPAVQERVAEMGLGDRVVFAGLRPDVPRILLGAMDVFLLPSLWEGLPLSGLEAQAAGLPIVLSDVITKEIDAVKPLVRRLSLSQPASIWAEAALTTKDTVPGITQPEALALLEMGPFNIQQGVKALEEVYASRVYQC